MANSSAEEEREIEVGILLLVVRWWMVVQTICFFVSLSISLHYLFSPVSDINEFNYYYYYIIVIIRSLSTAALNQKIVNISVAKLSQRQEGSQSVSH